MEKFAGFLVGFLLAGVIGWISSIILTYWMNQNSSPQSLFKIWIHEKLFQPLQLLLLSVTLFTSCIAIIIIMQFDWLMGGVFGFLFAGLIGIQLQMVRSSLKRLSMQIAKDRLAQSEKLEPTSSSPSSTKTRLIFVSVSPKDKIEKTELLNHLNILKTEGTDVWTEDDIRPGEDQYQTISEKVDEADLVILLITVNYLNSFEAQTRIIAQLRKQREHRNRVVISIIARPCAWERVGWITEISREILPADKKPVWRNDGFYADEELTKIVRRISLTLTSLSLENDYCQQSFDHS